MTSSASRSLSSSVHLAAAGEAERSRPKNPKRLGSFTRRVYRQIYRATFDHVIRNQQAYAALCEVEYWTRLSQMSIEDSITLGEQLLTSSAVDPTAFSDDDHPMSLARSLGIGPKKP